MNIKEALQYLFERGAETEKCARARILEVPSDGRTVVIEHKGELIDRTVPPDLRNHTVESVADLASAAKRWKPDPAIWIDGKQIVLIPDDQDRRDRVTLPLKQSAVFSCVKKLAEQPKMDQQQLIRLLRHELRNAVNIATILTAVRKIKFRSLTQGHADIQHGNESLGRQIESEVVGADAIPEGLTVPTNVFSNPGEIDLVFPVTLSLEIDVSAQKFLLKPMPDEIERVEDQALADIRERIEDGLPGVPVFFGRP